MDVVRSELGIAKGDQGQTIYILPDGKVYPSSAPIQANGDIFTLVANITITLYYDGIVIYRDDTVLDGAGNALIGPNIPESDTTAGVTGLESVRNVTIQNLVIEYFGYGIRLDSSGNSICCNHLNKNTIGFRLAGVTNNKIERNTIEDNNIGIGFYDSSNNTIHENYLSNIYFDVELWRVYEGIRSLNNSFFRNNFVGSNVSIG